MMYLVGAVISHVGRIRTVNQDRGLFIPYVGVVADGMGGHAGGEIASAIAVETFAGATENVPTEDLLRLGHLANARINERGQEPELRGMGTTLVAISLDGELGQVSLINVGDSRAYRLIPGGLERITRDHSFVEDLVEQGRISRTEARTHPQRNIVTRALGIDPEVEIDAFEVFVVPGDRFVLCSDGLVDEVEDGDIAEVLANVDDPKLAAQQLVELAVDAGGRDNITVLVADVAEGPEPGEPLDADDDVTGTIAPFADLDDPAPPTDVDGDEAVDEFDHEPMALRTRAMATLLIVTLAVAGFLAVEWFGGRTYFAGTDPLDQDSGAVVIYQGRPGGVLWVGPDVVEVTDVDVAELTDADIARLADRPLVSSLDEARDFVDGLDRRDE